MRLYRQNGKGPWWVTAGRGVSRIRQSTRETDYDLALVKAKEIVAPAMLRDEAERVVAAARAASRLRGEAGRMEGARLSWEEAWGRLDRVGRRGRARAESTWRDYRGRWECFRKAMEGKGHGAPGAVPEADARAWLLSLGARSQVVCHQVVGMVYRACGLVPPLGARPRRPPSEVLHREPLTLEQVRALLAACDAAASRASGTRISAEYRPLLLTMLYTGLRLGDAATLTAGMVDLGAGCLERRAAKTGRVVRFPLHPALLAELVPLAQAAAPEGELFPTLAAWHRAGHKALTKQVHRLMEAAGVKGEPGQFCAHCLRTTFASMCAERGVPLGVIQSWLGHASQEVTRIYARVEDMRAKAAAIARLPEF